MIGTFLLLGTSASAGVPVIGCKCKVCTSSSPFDRRMRSAGLIQANGKTILLDVGPDFHAQALRFQIDHLDGLILTHTHYDHIAGIDELRIFFVRQKKHMPCLLSEESFQDLKKRYDYLFHSPDEASLSAKFDFDRLKEDQGEKEFLGIPIYYFSYMQGTMKVNGYRFGDLAYVSDIRKFDPSIFESLRGIKTLVISALRPEPSSIHFSYQEAVDFGEMTGAEQIWITHLGHFLTHEEGNALLPPHVRLAYDGLKLEFNYA